MAVKKEKSTLEINEKTLAKADDVLKQMLDDVKARVPQNPALAIVKQKISMIDELCKEGATLAQVYERLNKALRLGISATSFTQYVRKIRQEVGSDLYIPREKKERKTKDKMVGEASANVERQQSTREEFACQECETKAERKESRSNPGKFYWSCPECKMVYDDADGKISNVRMK